MSIFSPNDTNASAPADVVQTFIALLGQADSVRVDGQTLTGWDTSDACGDAANEVARFSWIDDEGLEFSVTLTEGGIEEGRWSGEAFHCLDSEGDKVQMTMHRHIALTPQQ